jgi:hypothetical protein
LLSPVHEQHEQQRPRPRSGAEEVLVCSQVGAEEQNDSLMAAHSTIHISRPLHDGDLVRFPRFAEKVPVKPTVKSMSTPGPVIVV